MNRMTKILGALLFALALITSLGISSVSAHPLSRLPRPATTTQLPAPTEASVKLADGSVMHLPWGRPQFIHHVTNICTGVLTKARFRVSTGTRFINPGTCQSFNDESGFVQALPGN